jgi:hypothetical protein
MYEFDEGEELSKYFYEPENIKVANGLYVTNSEEKQRLKADRTLWRRQMNHEETWTFSKIGILRIEKRKLTYS